MSKVKRIFVATAAVAALGVTIQSASAFEIHGSRWGGGAQGDAATVTWSVSPDGTPIAGFNGEPNSPSNLVSRLRGIYSDAHDPLDTDYAGEAWFGQMNEAYSRWATVSGLTINYEPNDDGAAFVGAPGAVGIRGDLRVGGHAIDGSSGVLAYNFFPSSGGDQVIDTLGDTYENLANDSRKLRNVVIHEVGHGLGLDHTAGVPDNLMDAFTLVNPTFDGPQLDDILGIQRLYGDANESGGGNDTTATATNLGALAGGGSVAIGQDAIDATVDRFDTDFVSIDGASDTDVFMFTIGAGGKIDAILTSYATNNPGQMFNDLSLELLDSLGNVIATDDDGGVGAGESFDDFTLLAGDYFLRVGGGNDFANLYGLELSFTEETSVASVSAPGAALLLLAGLGVIGLRRRR